MVSETKSSTDDDARPYVIQPRDTALTIALMHEVEVVAITDHPKNAAIFKDKERDPHMLAPGEILYIPRPQAPKAQVCQKASNSFTARRPMVHLHLCFEGEAGPLSNEAFEITGPAELLTEKREDMNKPLLGKLNGEGTLSIKVPALTKSLVITFTERHVEHEISVGGLDPADTRGGLAARLLHLGFLPVDQELEDPFYFETETAERATLKLFQQAFLLEPTGFTDGRTKKALMDEHGC